jgi:DNA-binding LacI/PurR family transcriptional regulator/arylamine N-acetyltransferase
MPVTIKAVAEAAGVSPATVSNAYNRPGRLSPEVRERVLAVARDLGYPGPHAAGRSLRTGRAGAVGVLFTVDVSYAFTDPYYVTLLRGVTDVAGRSGTGVLLLPVVAPTDLPAGEPGEAEAVRSAVIDGALADGIADDHPAVQVLAARGLPLVRSSDSGEGPCVLVDDRAAGQAVGEHLAALGHRHVAVLTASPDEPGTATRDVDEDRLYPYSRLRLAGIRAGLGGDARVDVVTGGRNSAAAGRAAAELVLAGTDGPTAIAADSDVLALAVLAVLRERGLVPGADVSVTGFDGLPDALAAGLTTVRQPVREKGRAMARMLLDPDVTERRVVLPTELVPGATTGAARRAPSGPAGAVRPGTPPDEWQVADLDLAAYLDRIGCSGDLPPTAETLRVLHRAHVAAIPFENLDVVLGRGIGVELHRVADKLVRQRRGGYCYEHGSLLGAVLEHLGFRVQRMFARVGPDPAVPNRRSHLCLAVEADGRRWLADAGFGSGLLEPIPLAEGEPRQQGAWTFDVARTPDGRWTLRERQGDAWVALYTVGEEPLHWVDVDVANFETSTNPRSPFTHRPIAVRRTEETVDRLLGRELTVTSPEGSVVTRRLDDDEAFVAELVGRFGLPEGTARATARLAVRA